MKNISLFFATILIALVCLSCSANNDALFSTISHVDLKCNRHVEHLTDYDSPYTICYANEDGTYSLYIYNAPIQYKTGDSYTVIDNKIVLSEKDGFAFENKANEINTYFPDSLKEAFLVESNNEYMEFVLNEDISEFSKAVQKDCINMYGDIISAVVYESPNIDILFYSTRAGIKMEVIYKSKPSKNQLSFKVSSSSNSFVNNQNGYALFKSNTNNSGLIYTPIGMYRKEQEKHLDIASKIDVEKGEDTYNITITINQDVLNQAIYPLKYDLSFELYLSKTPDSTVYSKFDANNYLSNYFIVGEHPELGEGRHYTRFKLNQILYANSQDVIKSCFYSKNLYSKNESKNIFTYRPEEQWQSTQMTWDSAAKYGTEMISSEVSRKTNNYYEFDITDFTKQCLKDETRQIEDHGLVIKGTNDNYNMFSTSDNSLYPTYVKIDLRTEPKGFVVKENINN